MQLRSNRYTGRKCKLPKQQKLKEAVNANKPMLSTNPIANPIMKPISVSRFVESERFLPIFAAVMFGDKNVFGCFMRDMKHLHYNVQDNEEDDVLGKWKRHKEKNYG